MLRELWDSGSPRRMTKEQQRATEAHVSIIADVFVTEEEGASEQPKSEPQK